MESAQPSPPHLESNLWREVSQHLLLEESAARIVELLRQRFPVVGLAVRHLERDPDFWTTLHVSDGGASALSALAGRKSLDVAERLELEDWLTQGRPARLADLREPLRRLLADVPADCLALPLVVHGQCTGAAILEVDRSAPSASAASLGDTLAEAAGPLGVAVENDLRLHQLARLREALEADRTALLSRLHKDDIGETLIGQDRGLRAVTAQIHQVARTDVPVLILGETGSGKEVVARSLHAQSGRARGPIVRVNCGAIPTELVDSELFGHERGAFTGAVGQRKGWFERADGGTLFLDEIGELSLPAQVRLLRVLQEGTLERVGGTQTIVVDVRIVAATHRRLDAMVGEGKFREDLWYRLSVFPIQLPPLRERLEDLPALTTHFVRRAGRRLGIEDLESRISAQDLSALARYSWPGNVRELSAVVERAAILGSGRRLDLALALETGRAAQAPAPRLLTAEVSQAASRPTHSDLSAFSSLDEAMSDHIKLALSQSRGRIEGHNGAAALLDINPHTLRARMRRLGIDWHRFRTAFPGGLGQR